MLRGLITKIRAEVTVFDVMRQLGDWEGPDATKQVACKFHGLDRTPSARVYKDSGIMHCFACANPRYDAIRYVQLSEGISFKEAVYVIRDWFNISVPQEDESLVEELAKLLDKDHIQAVDKFTELEKLLVTVRGKVPFEKYLSWSNMLDQIEKAKQEGFLTQNRSDKELSYLEERIRWWENNTIAQPTS